MALIRSGLRAVPSFFSLLLMLLIAISIFPHVSHAMPLWLRQLLPANMLGLFQRGSQAQVAVPELPPRNMTARPSFEQRRTSMVGIGCQLELVHSNQKDYWHPMLALLMIDCARTGLVAEETFGMRRLSRDKSEGVWDELGRAEQHAFDTFSTHPGVGFFTQAGDDRAVELGLIAALVLKRKDLSTKLSTGERLGILDILHKSVEVLQRDEGLTGQQQDTLSMSLEWIEGLEEEIANNVCVAR
ncbi:hypothetical protein BX600DRAFT_468015 [Xylariales sp. PMI_506]|nr:hypothetical protein BX600DRAFT_468015 [Xylariales sp. PMI_506]